MNGDVLNGGALTGIDQGFENVMGRLFPIIGLHDKVVLEANLGIDLESKPFLWKQETEVLDH